MSKLPDDQPFLTDEQKDWLIAQSALFEKWIVQSSYIKDFLSTHKTVERHINYLESLVIQVESIVSELNKEVELNVSKSNVGIKKLEFK